MVKENEQIYKYLDTYGMSKMWIGYNYLATAIAFGIQNPQSYLKEIYSHTAAVYNVEPTQVSGAIRYAVKTSDATTLLDDKPKAFIKNACFKLSAEME